MDADDFFRQDALARGMTLSDYEREYGIQLTGGPAEARLKYNELPAGVMADEDVARASHFERNYVRKDRRRRPRSYARRPAARCASPRRRALGRYPRPVFLRAPRGRRRTALLQARGRLIG